MFWLPALTAISVAILSWAACGLVKDWAHEKRLLDVPNARSSHSVPVPRLGGVALITVTLAAALVSGAALGWSIGPVHIALFWGAIMIVVTGVLDDVHSRPLALRLVVQLTAAAVVVIAARMSAPVGLHSAWITATAVLWIVGLTNAYNFMDGIDGLAGVQSVVAGTAWAAAGWSVGDPWVGYGGLLLAAGSLGFLGHNWSPATLFMGDAGSTALGYVYAAFAVVVGIRAPGLALTAAAALWPFVFDASFTFLRRVTRGENVLQAHRSHLYQRLVAAGWRHDSVALLYGALAFGGFILAFALEGSASERLGPVVAIGGAGIGLWRLVATSEHRAVSTASLLAGLPEIEPPHAD